MRGKISSVKLFVRPGDKVSEKTAIRAAEFLVEMGAGVFVEPHTRHRKGFGHFSTLPNSQADLALVFGGDGSMLRAVGELGDAQKPVFGVSTGHKGFIMQSSTQSLEQDLQAIIDGDFRVEERSRIEGVVQGEVLPAALNEYAIVANKPVTLIRYALAVDGESLWEEEADGVLVSTPTGSTGYAESCGGVTLHENAAALEVVPMNPVNKRSRPVVVGNNSRIVIREILSPGHQIVIDGRVRVKTYAKEIEIKKAKSPALFVRVDRRRAESFRMEKFSPSARFVLKLLEEHTSVTQKELLQETGLPVRTLRDALSSLLEKDFIGKRTFLNDPRQSTYYLKRRDK